jgi:hypothetical protein
VKRSINQGAARQARSYCDRDNLIAAPWLILRFAQDDREEKMFIPLKYNIRNLAVRRTATLLTAFGIAVSVAVFVSVMALVEGMDDTFVTTGDARNIIALRRGALSETGSIIDIGAPLIVRNFPGVEAMSAERLVYVNTARLGTGSSNVVIRGLGDTGRALRPQVHLLRGRWYRPGARELTVSRSIASRFRATDLGDELKTGSARWKVVGISTPATPRIHPKCGPTPKARPRHFSAARGRTSSCAPRTRRRSRRCCRCWTRSRGSTSTRAARSPTSPSRRRRRRRSASSATSWPSSWPSARRSRR